ncbi:hypothetical protein Hypma_001158, partial [Hypsizygus marmoreus]
MPTIPPAPLSSILWAYMVCRARSAVFYLLGTRPPAKPSRCPDVHAPKLGQSDAADSDATQIPAGLVRGVTRSVDGGCRD